MSRGNDHVNKAQQEEPLEVSFGRDTGGGRKQEGH